MKLPPSRTKLAEVQTIKAWSSIVVVVVMVVSVVAAAVVVVVVMLFFPRVVSHYI